jgi:hypothetical protein
MTARHARGGACSDPTMDGERPHVPKCRRPERSNQARGLPACFEAPRVHEEAKVFHERVHDAYKIAMMPANASLRTTPGCTRRELATGGTSEWTQPSPGYCAAERKSPLRLPNDNYLNCITDRSEINCMQPPCWTRP